MDIFNNVRKMPRGAKTHPFVFKEYLNNLLLDCIQIKKIFSFINVSHNDINFDSLGGCLGHVTNLLLEMFIVIAYSNTHKN